MNANEQFISGKYNVGLSLPSCVKYLLHNGISAKQVHLILTEEPIEDEASLLEVLKKLGKNEWFGLMPAAAKLALRLYKSNKLVFLGTNIPENAGKNIWTTADDISNYIS